MESNRLGSLSVLRNQLAGIGLGLTDRVIKEIDRHRNAEGTNAQLTRLAIDVFSTVSNTAKLALFANKEFRQFTSDVTGSGYAWAVRVMAKGLLHVLMNATHEQLTGAARLLRQLADTADAIVVEETPPALEGVAADEPQDSTI